MIARLSLLCVALAAFQGASAFAPAHQQTGRSSTARDMAPKFDPTTQKWIPQNDEEATPAYGPVGSLIRAGPLPFVQRVLNGEEYEQGVYKMMATEKCDRLEAQGNMDAYLENPQDWAVQKMAEKKGAPKRDYGNANTSPKQLILSGIWACIVFYYAYDLISGYASGHYGFVDLMDPPIKNPSYNQYFSWMP
ncbi:unnamed protein product [Cylindrotheca closterium]|uniref:PSI-F n=1 Tax=Cylindrotheca closterium TaxID=2856 RepID=A0AAD2CWP1_9STRA|nr:unnamed protein product [Cylindrotheca closterium]